MCTLGGSLSTYGIISVYISPFNDPPLVRAPPPGTISTEIDAALGADIGQGGVLAVEDPDAKDSAYYSADGMRVEGPLSVQIIAGRGRLSLRAREGLSFAEGEGLDDPVMHFSGGIDDVNRAIASLEYRCRTVDGCSAGMDGIVVTVDDNGFTGKGGAMVGTATINVDVVITYV
ncbi:unnamed protein product [Choristocarpus tenellus]